MKKSSSARPKTCRIGAPVGENEVRRFENACALARSAAYEKEAKEENEENKKEVKIGTLSERRLHSVLKYYYQPDDKYHEIPFGSFFCDVIDESGIYEVQTRDLGKLVRKFGDLLSDGQTLPVNVIYPLAHEKHIVRIDTETGETVSRKKSPKHEDIYSSVRELYRLGKAVGDERVTVRLVFLSVTEYRTPTTGAHGRHRGSVRLERFPDRLISEATLSKREDYLIFLPEGLPETFTSSDVSALTGVRDPSTLMTVLTRAGCVTRVGKRGKSYLYRVSADETRK